VSDVEVAPRAIDHSRFFPTIVPARYPQPQKSRRSSLLNAVLASDFGGPMPANELTVSYANHEIRVVKTPTDGARLHIDGKLLDVTNDLFESEDEPTLV
jgi:hypothetical protein